MRITTQLVALIAVFLGSTSVFGSDQEQLKDSLKRWEKTCHQAQGNYSYEVVFTSFTGIGHVTEIVVRDNKVAERRFRELNLRTVKPVSPGEQLDYKWREKEKELGTHDEGAAVRTLDELYQDAAKVLERERPEYEKLYVRFDKQGFLQSCFTIDTRIADDAPQKGVQISALTLVFKAPNGKQFPKHWGPPPLQQTRDLRPLPGDYGEGSGTLAKWIAENLKRDEEKKDNER